MVAISALSQTKGERPQLVVGIIIDQLRSDYIELLQNHFGQNGFNRLLRDGVYFEDVNFDVADLDKVSGTSIVMTGAYPSISGVGGATIYDPQKKRSQYTLNDPSKLGNFTSETYSPAALKVSTIGDELRVSNDGLGYVYSIAPDPQQAIILAGHAGNCAFWINDLNGKWATSTFYKEVPQVISLRNYNNPLSSRIDTMAWNPVLPLKDYPDVPTYRKYYPFKYTFPNSLTRYSDYKKSALVNNEVTSVAISYIQGLKLGKREQTDMLNIAYTAAPYKVKDGDYSFELQDTYIRLDREIEKLLDAIDKNVGLRNAVVMISSTGYFDGGNKVDDKFNVPSGEFRPSRANSLLNLYLMAIYGNGQWVDGYNNQNFYLNRKLIKEKNVNLREVREKSSDFLRRMSGVATAYTLDEIISNPVDEEVKRLHRGLVLETAGDVRIEVRPGWRVVENENTTTEQVRYVRSNLVNTPAFILAPDIKAQKIIIPVDATILAPTVSRILRIRSPNAAAQRPYIL